MSELENVVGSGPLIKGSRWAIILLITPLKPYLWSIKRKKWLPNVSYGKQAMRLDFLYPEKEYLGCGSKEVHPSCENFQQPVIRIVVSMDDPLLWWETRKYPKLEFSSQKGTTQVINRSIMPFYLWWAISCKQSNIKWSPIYINHSYSKLISSYQLYDSRL